MGETGTGQFFWNKMGFKEQRIAGCPVATPKGIKKESADNQMIKFCMFFPG